MIYTRPTPAQLWRRTAITVADAYPVLATLLHEAAEHTDPLAHFEAWLETHEGHTAPEYPAMRLFVWRHVLRLRIAAHNLSPRLVSVANDKRKTLPTPDQIIRVAMIHEKLLYRYAEHCYRTELMEELCRDASPRPPSMSSTKASTTSSKTSATARQRSTTSSRV